MAALRLGWAAIRQLLRDRYKGERLWLLGFSNSSMDFSNARLANITQVLQRSSRALVNVNISSIRAKRSRRGHEQKCHWNWEEQSNYKVR